MLKIHEIIAKAAGKPLSAEECAELKAMADNSGNHSNSINDEITRLRNELANAINERDNARNQLAAAARKNQIDALAAKHRFCDPEYLDFLAKKENVNLECDSEVSSFIQKINSEKPRFFDIDLNSGAGGGSQYPATANPFNSAPDAASAPPFARPGAKEIARMLEDAPEAVY